VTRDVGPIGGRGCSEARNDLNRVSLTSHRREQAIRSGHKTAAPPVQVAVVWRSEGSIRPPFAPGVARQLAACPSKTSRGIGRRSWLYAEIFFWQNSTPWPALGVALAPVGLFGYFQKPAPLAFCGLGGMAFKSGRIELAVHGRCGRDRQRFGVGAEPGCRASSFKVVAGVAQDGRPNERGRLPIAGGPRFGMIP